MADDIDLVQAHVLAEEEANLMKAREAVNDIPVGVPGECVACGEQRPRLVKEHCARCRDEMGLP